MWTHLAALVLTCSAGRTPDQPFAELAFEPALAKAKSEQKLLLVDFTASWCGPCKKMDQTTWAAADVRAWLAQNAVAIQVDVDEQGELAERFQIHGMPTVVALRDGLEFDRVVGYRSAPEFLTWVRDVRAGKRASDALLERSRALRESADIGARYDLAGQLSQAGLYEEALAHYLWLWPETRKQASFAGVRLTFMLKEMAELASRHPPAKAAFAEILAGLQARVEAAPIPAPEDWREWTAFCEAFDGRARILAWYEAHRDEAGRLFGGRDEPGAQRVVDSVFEALMKAERVQEAGRLIADARKRAARMVEQYRAVGFKLEGEAEELRGEIYTGARRKLVDDLARLHAVMLVAERRDEAAAVAEILIDADDTPDTRLALVRAGLELAKRPDPSFTRWLDEAEAVGANTRILRRKLAKLERGGD